jgi:hypothetical protein
MFANLRCQTCGFTQQVPMGPGPTMAACNQCGQALQVPGAASAMPAYPQPQQYAQGPMPMQGYPRQGYYPYPPQKTSNNAGLIVGLCVVGFVVLIIAGSVFSAISDLNDINDSPQPPPQISTSGESPTYNYKPPKFRSWLMRTSSEGHFAIDMPGKPFEGERTLRNDEGRLKAHSLTFREDDAEWEVEYWDFPEHDVSDDAYSLGGEIDVLAKAHGCQPEGEKEITLTSLMGEKFEGREVHFQTLDDSYDYRIYCVRNRMFVICALTRDSVKESEPLRFLNSFRLIGNIPKEGWPSEFLPEPDKKDRGTAVPKPK